jgi:signal transduction histidine kinase
MSENSETSKSGPRWYSIGKPPKIQIIVWILLAIVFMTGLLDLAGWIFDIKSFRSIEPQWVQMKTITALSFILSAISVFLIQSGSFSRMKIRLSGTFIAFVIITGLITIIDYFYFKITGHEADITGIPVLNLFLLPENRMSLISASIFLLIGSILLLLCLNNDRADNLAHVLIFPASLLSYFIPVSYILSIYSENTLHDIQASLNSGIAFCSLCSAIIMIRPRTWLMKVFTSKNPGGIMARRLLLGLILLPIIIGWLRIYGEHTSLYKSEVGVAIVAITYTACFILLLWFAARSVNQIDEKRNIYEEALIKSYAKLESANQALNKELTERNLAEQALKLSETQLKELIATKDKFFNIVAHDLKNPFTSLLGCTELLFENIDRLDIDKVRQLAVILNESAKNGYNILQNLLDWSRSQTDSLNFNPERINLKALIEENISNLRLNAINKEINLHSAVEKDIFVNADKNMLNTVLRNLISNAIKFTQRGGNISISTIIDLNQVTISVKDSGTGISKENIKKLFRIDSKFQLPGTDKEIGTGLGLKLCREFVEKQGGKIWVESEENKGCDFKFTIPV